MRQKVAAALEQAEALEAKIDAKQAEHTKAIAAMNAEKSSLQQKLADTQIASHSISMQLQAAAEKAARQSRLLLDEQLPVLQLVLVSCDNASDSCSLNAIPPFSPSHTVPLSISMLRDLAIAYRCCTLTSTDVYNRQCSRKTLKVDLDWAPAGQRRNMLIWRPPPRRTGQGLLRRLLRTESCLPQCAPCRRSVTHAR